MRRLINWRRTFLFLLLAVGLLLITESFWISLGILLLLLIVDRLLAQYDTRRKRKRTDEEGGKNSA